MKKARKMTAFVIVLAMLFTLFALPANASSDSSDIVYKVSDVQANVIEILDAYDVSYNMDSTIRVIDMGSNNRSTNPSSALSISTQNGNNTECSLLLSFSQDEDGGTELYDFGRAVFRQTRDSETPDELMDMNGIRVKAVTVFDSYRSRQYIRPLSEFFILYTGDKSVAPTRFHIETELPGDLYSKSGDNYSLIKRDCLYVNPYTVYSPAFNTVYSKNNALDSDRVISPTWQVIGGFSCMVNATFPGGDYFDDVFYIN